MYLITIITDNKPQRFYITDLSKVTQFIEEIHPTCVMVEPLPIFPEEAPCIESLEQKGGNNE